MKAIQVTAAGGPEVLKLVDLPEPEPGPGMVRVRNRAIGINFHDIVARREGEPGLSHPFVPGTDFAGEVEAVGSGLERLRQGDRVLGINTHGAYAEATLLPESLATPIPDDLSFEQAAACPVAGLTAYFLIHDNYVGPGSTVVAHAAAGSVGCFLGGLLHRIGATAIGLVSSDDKAKVARRASYTHRINYRREDPVVRVRELTGGRGADLVLDSVAGPRFPQSLQMAAAGGTVVLFGRAAGPPDLGALQAELLESRRNLGLRTYFLGTTLATELERIPGAYAALFDALRGGSVHLPLEVVGLEEAPDAHARIESQQTVGKLILRP